MIHILSHAGVFANSLNVVSSGLDGHAVKLTICSGSQVRATDYWSVVSIVESIEHPSDAGLSLDLIGHTKEHAVSIGEWRVGHDGMDLGALKAALLCRKVTTVRLLGCESGSDHKLLVSIQDALGEKIAVQGAPTLLDSTDFNAAGLRPGRTLIDARDPKATVDDTCWKRVSLAESVADPAAFLRRLDRERLPWIASIPRQFPHGVRWDVEVVLWNVYLNHLTKLFEFAAPSLCRGLMMLPDREYASCDTCGEPCACKRSVRLAIGGGGRIAVVPLNDGLAAVFEAPDGASWATILQL